MRIANVCCPTAVLATMVNVHCRSAENELKYYLPGCFVLTYVHVCTQSSSADEEPIYRVVFRCGWQKVGAPIMFTKFFSCLRITITPAKVPRLIARLWLHALFRHIQSFVKVVEARLVGQKLTIEYFLFAFRIEINVTKVPIIEFLQRNEILRVICIFEIVTNINI